MSDRYLTTAEVAELLRLQVVTIRRWCEGGRIDATKLPGRGGWRIRESDVAAMLDKRTAGRSGEEIAR